MANIKSQAAATAFGPFSVEQAASYIGVSRRGLFRLFSTGALPRTKIGYRTVVQRAHVDALLANCVEKRGNQAADDSGRRMA